MGTINRPIAFAGSEAEKRANRASHNFATFQYSEDDAETRCYDCDSRPSHYAADYPCGASVPRETITYGAA